MKKINRRELLAGALPGCAHFCAVLLPTTRGRKLLDPRAPKPLVAVIRAAAYTQDIYDTVRRIVADHN